MTIQTWLEEFMPTPAEECKTWIDAARNSLKKWQGFTSKNLEKHGLGVDEVRRDDYDSYYECALCLKVMETTHKECTDLCPLFQFLRMECSDSDESPWRVWRRTNDPQPMIDALQGTIKMLADESETK